MYHKLGKDVDHEFAMLRLPSLQRIDGVLRHRNCLTLRAILTSELISEWPDHWRRDAHTTCAKILNKPPNSEGRISENSPRAGMGKNGQTCECETCEGDHRKYPATIRVERSLGCTGLPGEVAHGAFKSVVLFLQNINGWVLLRN